MKSNFIKNLIISFGISLILIIITSVASFISIKNLLNSADQVDHTNNVIQKLEETLSIMKDAETGQRGYLLTGESNFLSPYNGAQARAKETIDAIRTMIDDNEEQLGDWSQLDVIVNKRMSKLQRLIDLKQKGLPVEIVLLREGKQDMDEARKVVSLMTLREKRLLEERTTTMNQFAAFTPILIVLAAIFSVIITLLSFGKIRSEFLERSKLQTELIAKDADITRRIDIIQSLANKIAAGDYSIRLDETEKDGLGSLAYSLNTMTESLEDSFKELSENEWLQTGIAQLNNEMVGDQDIPSLTGKIIEYLSIYTSSNTGALYVTHGNTLTLSASYALRITEKNRVLNIGEGYAGQCAVSGREILTNTLPEDDIYISYASGEAKPGNILAIPILHENKPLAVIELASFDRFTPNKLDFLKTSAHNIGISIVSAQARKRMQELLEETQSQTEELQSQQGELENLNSELEAQTQKLQASEEELRVQQEELMQSNQELEERSRLLEEKNQMILQRNLEIQKNAEELSLSTKYKSEFLANMSHELRTPLNSILLLSRMMADNKEGRLKDEEISYAKVIKSSGEGLLNLIDEILDLSKIEAGKMALEPAQVSIKEILDDMITLFNPLAVEKDLELRTNISLDAPATIYTDKMRLEQILKNLISNALKFTSKGYISLDITVHPIDPGYLNFKVKDTGIGIPADKQQLVFEAFQQADGSTRRKYGGTGLGLSISRELSKLLRGEIKLTSEPGVGTEFTVTIPIMENAHRLISGNEPETISTESRYVLTEEDEREIERVRFLNPVTPSALPDDRDIITREDKVILLIEDDTSFALALQNFSRKMGYKTLVAVSGDQGIALAKTYKPLAILLDIVLPVKDGWEVMEALKADPQTRHIPVHIMSSMEVKKEGLQKGAIDYINKPFALDKMKEVFQKLERALNRENRKVLIVEENTKHAKALSFFLETFNVTSEIKSNIQESVNALKEKAVDCVILDMGVPDNNAYETLEAIKKNAGLENLPIIIFTGKNLSNSEENRIKQYADTIVVKTAHSYQRILDEVSLFLHIIGSPSSLKKEANGSSSLGALHEVLKDKTVLIADDDVRNIFSLTKILEQYQMRVISATDGKEALRQVQQNPNIDLVLMDMMMPEMDGYEATRKIRSIPRFKRLPILAVTAKAMMGDRDKCMNAGASDYISKPVDSDQLVSLLRVWLYDRDV